MTMQNKTVRCDQCGAEAWVSVAKVGSGQLDLCFHHYNTNSIQLHAEGWVITNDERATLQGGVQNVLEVQETVGISQED